MSEERQVSGPQGEEVPTAKAQEKPSKSSREEEVVDKAESRARIPEAVFVVGVQ